MMTPSHARFAARLADSCQRHGLPLALYEVPTVHRSISVRGSGDLRYTKPNFLRFLLQRYSRPILYLDADCVIAQPLRFVEDLLASSIDFAIFNWLAEPHTEAYVSTDVTRWASLAALASPGRFYRFSHSIDARCETQLLCSGAVQWYNTTSAASQLLDAWQRVIEQAPGCADDKCLDFAFNHLPTESVPLKFKWLGKSQARYGWWIYERPIIDHPEIPYSGSAFTPLHELAGKPRIDAARLRQEPVEYVFPKPCLIDATTRTLLRLSDDAWQTVGSFTTPLWLSDAMATP